MTCRRAWPARLRAEPRPARAHGEADQARHVGAAQGRGGQAVAGQRAARLGVVEAHVVAEVVAVAPEREVQAALEGRGVAERASTRVRPPAPSRSAIMRSMTSWRGASATTR